MNVHCTSYKLTAVRFYAFNKYFTFVPIISEKYGGIVIPSFSLTAVRLLVFLIVLCYSNNLD